MYNRLSHIIIQPSTSTCINNSIKACSQAVNHTGCDTAVQIPVHVTRRGKWRVHSLPQAYMYIVCLACTSYRPTTFRTLEFSTYNSRAMNVLEKVVIVDDILAQSLRPIIPTMSARYSKVAR